MYRNPAARTKKITTARILIATTLPGVTPVIKKNKNTMCIYENDNLLKSYLHQSRTN